MKWTWCPVTIAKWDVVVHAQIIGQAGYRSLEPVRNQGNVSAARRVLLIGNQWNGRGISSIDRVERGPQYGRFDS